MAEGAPRPAAGPSGQSARPPTEVFVTGTFDVENYGDLLFPLVAAGRLAAPGLSVVPVSPTASRTRWADAAACVALPDLLAERIRPRGILIGGGNIVHAGAANLVDYEADGPDWAYASLWLGATVAATLRNVPVIWNAPGVPRPLAAVPGLKHVMVRQAFEAANYVSVRDAASLEHLGPTGGATVAVVPDTAVDVARLWPRERLAATFARLLERKGFAAEGRRFLSLHVKARSTELAPEIMGERIGAFAAAHGLTPVLVPLGPCHHDDVTVRRIGRHVPGPAVVVDDPQSLEEIAAVIANASLHLGSSLHGYITAAACDVPSLVVARPALPKFAGFLAHIGRPQDLVASWEEAFAGAPARLAEATGPLVPASVHAALDAHWARVVAELSAPRSNMLQQARFLRSTVQRGIGVSGWSWLFAPPFDRSPP